MRIEVEDVNDNAPIIKIKFIVDSKNMTGNMLINTGYLFQYNKKDSSAGYVSEGATTQTYIAHVAATDVDDGVNGEVTTTITTFGRFRRQKGKHRLRSRVLSVGD